MFWSVFNHLHTRTIGCSIREFEVVDSTNRLAADCARKGESEGTVFIAGEQLAGRGRLGRNWQSAPGQGLYFSVILRPSLPIREAGRLSLGAALAVQHVLHRYYGQPAEVKWPNDILIGGAKLAGILTENLGSPGGLDPLILGIGININWPEGLADENQGDFRRRPTALNLEIGSPVERDFLLGKLLYSLDSMYSALHQGRWFRLLSQLQRCLYGKNRQIRVTNGKNVIAGTVLRLADDGGLVLADAAGREQTVYSGEVEFADRD